jgi:anaerobic ribonucleoside-triphosphate reductase
MCIIDDKAKMAPACYTIVAGTDICSVCGHIVCPICQRHTVTQISRVTGYMSDVSGWNNGKKQEFLDRKRYSI